MSPLTFVELPGEDVPLSNGASQRVRALSWAESLAWEKIEPDGGDTKFVALIAAATDSTTDEARAWVGGTPTADVAAVSAAAARLSKLGAAEGEASRAPSSARKRTRSPSSSRKPSG